VEFDFVKALIDKSSYDKKREIVRYVRFVLSATVEYSGTFEKHHILPVALFPEYKKSSWNIVSIDARVHYIAHYMLAKIFGGKMWFAFNNMRRIFRLDVHRNPGKSSNMLYSYARKYLAEELRKINLGRKFDESQKRKMSEMRKGTIVVRDETGKKFRTSVFDERYLSGELIPHQTGRRHGAETIQKMSVNNGVTGKSLYTDGSKFIFLKSTDKIPSGFVRGHSTEMKEAMSLRVKDTIWITDTLTGKKFRTKDEDILSNPRYVRGRGEDGGFNYINSLTMVINLITLKYERVSVLEQWHYPYSGHRIHNITCFTDNGFVMLGRSVLSRYLKISGRSMEHVIEVPLLQFKYGDEKPWK